MKPPPPKIKRPCDCQLEVGSCYCLGWEGVRCVAKNIAIKAMNNEITQLEAEQQLLLLYNSDYQLSDEKAMPPIGGKRRDKILEADGNRCFYCGTKTYPVKDVREYDSATIDHILPKSAGGIDHIDNCVNSCSWCNNRKGDYFIVPPKIVSKTI